MKNPQSYLVKSSNKYKTKARVLLSLCWRKDKNIIFHYINHWDRTNDVTLFTFDVKMVSTLVEFKLNVNKKCVFIFLFFHQRNLLLFFYFASFVNGGVSPCKYKDILHKIKKNFDSIYDEEKNRTRSSRKMILFLMKLFAV